MSVALMFSRRAEDLSFGIIHLGNDAKCDLGQKYFLVFQFFLIILPDLTGMKISKNDEEDLKLQFFFFFLPILNISNANCQTM